jgi:Zn finger protein HypA/HybF involved in hydrogenase expression
LAPCDILLSSVLVHPELDRKAEESIQWTQEAEERMTRVPPLVKGIARTGILRIAVEKGHSVVTNSLIDEAMDRFMPKQAAKATDKLAETLAFNQARKGNTALCISCGTTAKEESPVKCAVCGSANFEIITPETIEKIIESEGGAKDETTYDGKKLTWTKEARKLLPAIKDAYQKRRAKAYIEKAARMRRLNAVTLEFTEEILKELGHEDSLEEQAQSSLPEDPNTLLEQEINGGVKLIARDAKGTPLKSVFEWTPEATERILRVPSGFMRDKVQERIESVALDNKVITIDLDLVEKGIEIGRMMMEEMITSQSNGQSAVSNGNSHSRIASPPVYGSEDVNDYPPNQPPKENLNEVSVMSELDKKRSDN